MRIFKPTLLKILIIPIHILLCLKLSYGLAFFVQAIYIIVFGLLIGLFFLIDFLLLHFIENRNTAFKIELIISILYLIIIFLYLKNS